MPRRLVTALKILPLLLILLVPLLVLRIPAAQDGLLRAVDALREGGPLGALAYVGVYAIAVILTAPMAPFAATAGFTYGLPLGLLIAAPAGTVAASAAFLTGRTVARRWLTQRGAGDGRWEILQNAVDRQGFRMTLLLRLSPVFPQNYLNYLLALSRLRLSHFAAATLLGMLPITTLQVYLGSLVRDATELLQGGGSLPQSQSVILLSLGGVVTVTTLILLGRITRRALQQASLPPFPTDSPPPGPSGAALILGVMMTASAADALASSPSLVDLAETRNFTLGMPVSALSLPKGEGVLFLRSPPRIPQLSLWETDLKTGSTREVLTPAQVLAGGQEELSPEEKARRERMRQALMGFTSFSLSPDGEQVFLPLGGRMLRFTRGTGRVETLPGTGWIDPQLSPDGRKLAGVMGGELWVLNLETLSLTALTAGATESLTHGVAEFVAQEEMDRFVGFWWSPDSQQLAWQENDLSSVETLYIHDPAHPLAAPTGSRYPRAGTPNARVRLGVVAVQGGETRWIAWDSERFPYLCRVSWSTLGAPLTLLVQSRSQQSAQVLAVDGESLQTRVLLEETDSAWLNLDPSPLPMWREGGKEFLWSTERRGGWQLEVRGADGSFLRELTGLEVGYSRLVTLGENWVVVEGTGQDPTQKHLYWVGWKKGTASRYTREPGVHSASLKGGPLLVVTSLLEDGGMKVRVMDHMGHVRGELPLAVETPGSLPQVEWTRTTPSGETPALDAALVRPANFHSGRAYPVILHVYAGPTHKVVSRSPWSWFHAQWLADQGFVVVSMDGRGTPGHGRAFQRVVRGSLIDAPLADQVAGLKDLGGRYPELDLSRVVMSGWSFGGYFTAMAVLRHPQVFRGGMAGAPVTDWRDYDTHYTERYLGLPQEDPSAYERSSVLPYAKELARPLLLVHGLTDDNVFFAHTASLADALFKAGRPYQLLPLTGTHMVSNPAVRVHLWERVVEFLKGCLSGDLAPRPLK